MQSTETHGAHVTITVPGPGGRHDPRRGGKGWAKAVTGIDRSQRGGYAILGDFVRGTLGVLPGTLILTVGEDRNARGRYNHHCVDLYRVGHDGSLDQLYSEQHGRSWVEPTLDVIEQAMAAEPKPAEVSDGEQDVAEVYDPRTGEFVRVTDLPTDPDELDGLIEALIEDANRGAEAADTPEAGYHYLAQRLEMAAMVADRTAKAVRS